MAGDSRHQEEMSAELSIQLRLLAKACNEFDKGDYDEIRNIARALRVLLTADDHGKPSLLAAAGMGGEEFPDTRAITHARNISPEFSLVGIVLGPDNSGIRALLNDAKPNGLFKFIDWLEQIVCDDKEGNYFSRHRLIKAVANLGGGTHFPPNIREYYRKLEQLSVEVEVAGRLEKIQFRDVEKHSLRQVAFEVLSAFDSTAGTGARIEPGTIMIRGVSMILYPGRTLHTSADIKTKQAAGPVVAVETGQFQSISSFMTKLPYEGTGRNAECPCGSGLKFKNCCQVARDFDAAFIDDFEQRYRLGRYAI